MTIVLIAIITTNIALAGLMIGLFRWLKQDIRELNNRIDNLSNTLGGLRNRLAHLEGLIEGLFRSLPIIPSPDNPDEQNRAA